MWTGMLNVLKDKEPNKEKQKLEADKFAWMKEMEVRRLALEEKREENTKEIRLKELDNSMEQQKMSKAMLDVLQTLAAKLGK